MSKKQVIAKGDEARAKIMKGADFLADCVKQTLGPYGQNWILPNVKKVTNDGLAVAAEIRLDDEIENEGARAMHKIALAVADKAFDATSTATVLAQSILKEASKYLGNKEKGIIAKRSAIDIKEQINKECKEVSAKLWGMTEPITTKKGLVKSAMVSVEDQILADLIGDMQYELGPEGYIISETGDGAESTIERVSGFRVENSLATALVLNNQEKQCMDVSEVGVILTNHNITDMKPLAPMLELLAKSGTKKVVVLGRMFSMQAVQMCLQNMNQGGMEIYPLNAPFGNQVEMLKDLQALVGGTMIHDEERGLEDVQVSDVGFAKRVIANKNSSTFIVDRNEERVGERIKALEDKLKSDMSDWNRQKLNERLAQLKNGFAILKVGSTSVDDKSYKKDKVEDAVNAVRLAYQGGVVPGAGLAFKMIADGLPDDYILKTPLKSIHKHIVESAPTGFVIEEWVKDPTKVLDIALHEACLGAGVIATAGGVAVFSNEPEGCKCASSGQ